jgi:hypothetical protein
VRGARVSSLYSCTGIVSILRTDSVPPCLHSHAPRYARPVKSKPDKPPADAELKRRIEDLIAYKGGGTKPVGVLALRVGAA